MSNSLLRILLWLVKRLLLFVGIVGFAVAVIFLRAGVVVRPGQISTLDWGRYWPALKQYVLHLLHGSFGYYYLAPTGHGAAPVPVPLRTTISSVLLRNLPLSLTLFISALLVGCAFGILLGLLASRFSWTWVRKPGLSLTLLGLSLPDVLLVLLIQYLFILWYVRFGFELLPVYGDPLRKMSVSGLVVPALLLASFPSAYIARVSVAAFDDISSEEYIRTAKAKGLSNGGVLWKHAFKNAMVQILGGLPTAAGVIISNLIIVEYYLAQPGIGRMLTLEFQAKYPSPNLIASIAICLAAMFTFVDSLVDALLRWIDPRSEVALQEAKSAPFAWLRRLIGLIAALPGRVRRLAAARRQRATPAPGATERPAGTPRLTVVPRPAAAQMEVRESEPGRRAPGEEDLSPRSFLYGLRKLYRGNFPLIFGTLIIALLLLVAALAPVLAPHDPNQMTPVLFIGKRYSMPPFPPSAQFRLGTDAVGRDLLSRVLYGTRYTLLIAALVVPLRVLCGLLAGMAAGWLGGWWAKMVRGLAVLFGAIPTLVIPAILVPTLFGRSVAQSLGNPNAPKPPTPFLVLTINCAILVLIGWPRLAESVRLMTREVLEHPFVESARAVGASTWRLMKSYLFPQMAPRLAVMAAAEAAWLMMLLVQLGIFGVWLGGAQNLESVGMVQSYPDWSGMLSDPVFYIRDSQWVILVPAVAFFIAMAGFQLLAEGFRRSSLRSEEQVGIDESEVVRAS